MTVDTRRMTVEEFDQFVLLPENADKSFEYIAGEIIEVVSNDRSAEIAMIIGAFITVFVLQHQLGRVTGADGGYIIAGERYIPDFAYTSKLRKPKPSGEAYSSVTPDLVVEVLSPANTAAEMRVKVINYLHDGVTVWIVDPDKKRVEVYAPDQPSKVVDIKGTLDGGSVLPGFTLAVKDIFPE